MASDPSSSFKSLAPWKSWWKGTDFPKNVAKSMYDYMDTTQIAGNGRLLHLDTKGKATEKDAKTHAKLCEGLLRAYPAERDPSGYLLGDSVLHLDIMLNHAILGRPEGNPMKEASRRDNALRDGTNLKLLLSYIRNSSARSDKGRHVEITYLKDLVNTNFKPKRRSGVSVCSSTATPSPTSPSTCSATTIGLDGQSLYVDDVTTSGEERPRLLGYKDNSKQNIKILRQRHRCMV